MKVTLQAHAAAALVNFSEDCPKPILTLYLDPLMIKLEVILTTKFKEVFFMHIFFCGPMFVSGILL